MADKRSVKLPGFVKTVQPSYDDITCCIHCGLCLPSCPTYQETGMETESPRGRLHLIRAFAEGRIEADSASLHEHLDLCLQCRACESACPSGVRYGYLIEKTLDELAKRPENEQSLGQKLWRYVIFRQLFPKPLAWRILGLSLRFYQQSGLQGWFRQAILAKLPKLAELESLLPKISQPLFVAPNKGVVAARTEQRYRVALFGGCIMRVAFGHVNEATVRVLTRNGCEVVVPDKQICCGALNVHNGDREYGREMARRNVVAFEAAQKEYGKFDAIIINAAGCGSTLKEYGDLLVDDVEFGERAANFAHLVKDVTEFLGTIDFNRNFGRLERRVTYQDACHLAHAQRIKNPPRVLLKAIPGLELVEMWGSDVCCGSAGLYNVTQPEMSRQILGHKVEHVRATGVEWVVTTNPGCQMQLESGLGDLMRVVHLVEVLDEGYRVGEEGG